MNITEKNFKEQYYKTINGIKISPIFNYDSYNQKTSMYTNLVIEKTAEQVYQEWQENKNKSVNEVLTQEQINANLLTQLAQLKQEIKVLKEGTLNV